MLTILACVVCFLAGAYVMDKWLTHSHGVQSASKSADTLSTAEHIALKTASNLKADIAEEVGKAVKKVEKTA